MKQINRQDCIERAKELLAQIDQKKDDQQEVAYLAEMVIQVLEMLK